MVAWEWCTQVRTSSEPQLDALREVWWHARGRRHCRGESGSALSGGYATRPRVAVPGETNLPTKVTTGTTVA